MANAFAPGEEILPDSSGPPPLASSPSRDDPAGAGPDKITSGLSNIAEQRGREDAGALSGFSRTIGEDVWRTHKAYDAEAATSHDIPSWNEQQQKEKFATDPVKAFGSVGSVFAMVAAAFTHRPMINALQGSAAAMDAVREGDEKAYKNAYTAWKDNTALALKRHDMMHQEYQDAESLMHTDMAAGKLQMEMIARKYDDKQTLFLTENGLNEELNKLREGRVKSAEELRKHVNNFKEDTLANNVHEQMVGQINKAFEGRPKDDQYRLGLLAEADRRYLHTLQGGKTTLMEDEQWQTIIQWEKEHAQDNNGAGPKAEERQKFLQGFRTTLARETPDMEFLRKYQEEHPNTPIEDAYTALSESKNSSKTKLAAARQEEINRHNQAIEAISSRKGDTSADMAEEKKRHDTMLEQLDYGRLTETVRSHTVAAQIADARQDETNRHNQAIEAISTGKGDVSARLAEEKERHDKAVEELGQSRLDKAASKLPTNAGEEAQAVEEMMAVNPGMKREEAIAGVKSRIAEAVSKAKLGSDALLDDETVSVMADQYMAGDKSVLQNLGRGAQGAQNIVKVREAVMRKAKQQGLKGPDLALRMAEFSGVQAGERALGTRTANVEMFANETINMIGVARKASLDVPRSQWIPVNKALQAFESNTGDPKIRAFGAALNSLVNTYAKAIAGGGQATVSDKDHAREIITSADSQAQFDAVMDIIDKELKAAREAPGQVKEQFRDLAGSNKLDKPLAPDQNVIRYDINGKRIP